MLSLITVVVPCFNYGRFLEACVDSILRQSYGEWECIIVDDGSTDDTPVVCAELVRRDARIAVIRQRNAGLSAARNAGIRLARGAFIQLLDADDVLQTDKLSLQVGYLTANPDVDIVVGRAGFFDTDDPTHIRSWRRSGAGGETGEMSSDPLDVLKALVERNILVVHAALIRRQVFETVGYFDDSLRAYEDWDFWLRCALAGKRFGFFSAEKDRALVREHALNMTWDRARMITAAIRVRERIQPHLGSQLQSENAERLTRFKVKLAVELMRNGKAIEGWRLFRSAWGQSSRKVVAATELAGLIPGAFRAVHLGRRVCANWRASANSR